MAERKPKSIELSESVLSIALNLERLYAPTPALIDFLDASGVLSPLDTMLLDEVSEKLLKNADSWNEEELKMQYISMVIFLARFSDKMRTYYDREIDADVNSVYIKCKADMMLSKGVGEVIQTPYFFLHTYKKKVSLLRRDGREAILATRLGRCSAVCSLRKRKTTTTNLFMAAMCKVDFGFFRF